MLSYAPCSWTAIDRASLDALAASSELRSSLPVDLHATQHAATTRRMRHQISNVRGLYCANLEKVTTELLSSEQGMEIRHVSTMLDRACAMKVHPIALRSVGEDFFRNQVNAQQDQTA